MILDARSNGLIYLISSSLIFIKATHLRLSGIKKIFLFIFVTSIFYFGYVFYVNQVLFKGIGGSNSRTQLNKTSNPYNPFELIYYGRTEFFVLIQAISDKPIFGHGSWGKDPNSHYARIFSNLSNTSTINDRGYIPAHSIILGIWAYSGILGFVVALFMFYKLYILFYRIYKSEMHSIVFPIIVVTFVDLAWTFLFSPIGLLRMSFPICAALLIIENTKITENKISISYFKHKLYSRHKIKKRNALAMSNIQNGFKDND